MSKSDDEIRARAAAYIAIESADGVHPILVVLFVVVCCVATAWLSRCYTLEQQQQQVEECKR